MFALQKNKRQHSRHRDRSAVATVELAICLPVLVLLTLGTIDVCSLLFLKEAITIAAYEGARQGVGRGHTDADAIARVTEFLNQRNIQFGADAVQISGPGFDGADTLQNVTLTVTVPCAGNLLIPTQMFGDMNMSADVTMRKEYANLNQ